MCGRGLKFVFSKYTNAYFARVIVLRNGSFGAIQYK